MKKIIFSVLIVVLSLPLFSQKPLEQAQKDFSYTFVQEDGTNASAVVWHPELQMYFTLIAGNSDFPLEGFDAQGKNTYKAQVKEDARGLWYNPKNKRLEMNLAGSEGWRAIILEKDLSSHKIKTLFNNGFQPDFQSVGTFDVSKKQVVFFNSDAGTIEAYNYKKPESKTITPLEPRSGDASAFNSTSIGYTGKKGYEFVLLNRNTNTLVFFNRDGKEKASTILPEEAPVNDMFRFAFANDRVFLYDADSRIWTAYKVF